MEKIKSLLKSFRNYLNDGYDYNPKFDPYDWKDIGIIFEHPPKHIFEIMYNYPGNNITTYEGDYLYRGVWMPPENWNGEKVSTTFYYWYKKKMTKKEKDEIDKNSIN